MVWSGTSRQTAKHDKQQEDFQYCTVYRTRLCVLAGQHMYCCFSCIIWFCIWTGLMLLETISHFFDWRFAGLKFPRLEADLAASLIPHRSRHLQSSAYKHDRDYYVQLTTFSTRWLGGTYIDCFAPTNRSVPGDQFEVVWIAAPRALHKTKF